MNPMNTHPRWFQLIEAHQTLRPGRYALTIPFLVGGVRDNPKSRKTSPDDVRAEILNLVTSILDAAPPDRVVFIHRCIPLGQPVVALHRSGDVLPNGLESAAQRRMTLFVEDEFSANGQYSALSLTNRFFSDFHADICAGNFSFRGRGYGPFSDVSVGDEIDDLKLIEVSRSM